MPSSKVRSQDQHLGGAPGARTLNPRIKSPPHAVGCGTSGTHILRTVLARGLWRLNLCEHCAYRAYPRLARWLALAHDQRGLLQALGCGLGVGLVQLNADRLAAKAGGNSKRAA